jgi:hypothetical protein
VTRDELIAATRRLVDDGERLSIDPSMSALRTWLQASDALLAEAWGSMDRYHLAWLGVGRPRQQIRRRRMTPQEEKDYVLEVTGQKTAALRMSLKAAEDGMPFRGEGDAERAATST